MFLDSSGEKDHVPTVIREEDNQQNNSMDIEDENEENEPKGPSAEEVTFLTLNSGPRCLNIIIKNELKNCGLTDISLNFFMLQKYFFQVIEKLDKVKTLKFEYPNTSINVQYLENLLEYKYYSHQSELVETTLEDTLSYLHSIRKLKENVTEILIFEHNTACNTD